jgi:HPt (histidine-containing phosphotransfer) domain-containing protein
MTHPEPTNPSGGAPAVDFMALLGRCLGNFKMVEKVLATFRETGLSDLNQLEEAVNVSDFQAVEEISHRFKGSASNVSAVGLRDILLCVERLARETNYEELIAILPQLRTEWEDFKRYAEVFAPTPKNGAMETITRAFGSLEARHACAGC